MHDIYNGLLAEKKLARRWDTSFLTIQQGSR